LELSKVFDHELLERDLEEAERAVERLHTEPTEVKRKLRSPRLQYREEHKAEDEIKKLDLPGSLKRLFTFIEDECNISPHILEGRAFKALKGRINELMLNQSMQST
jgi:hypothetical protein